MRTVPVTAQLCAPVAIKRDRQSDRSENVRSVAGTLVRGALASIYLQHHGQPDDVFQRLFLNEAACRFGPLDPGTLLFPLTAVSCKREGLRHALVDLLWFRAAQHHAEGRVREDIEVAWRECAKCKGQSESAGRLLATTRWTPARDEAGWAARRRPCRDRPADRHSRGVDVLHPGSPGALRRRDPTCTAGSRPMTMRSTPCSNSCEPKAVGFR